jgi:hypothetical protein
MLSAAGPSGGAPLPQSAPQLGVELEAQYGQPGDQRSRGFGLGLGVAWRMTDQLSALGAVTELVTRAGPVSTLGFGLRALLDATPLAPFLELEVVALGPGEITGYHLATRLGAGADWRVTPALALGLAVRTLTPVDPTALSAAPSAGIEIALRLIVTPGFLQ